jgi:hypothetical protein
MGLLSTQKIGQSSPSDSTPAATEFDAYVSTQVSFMGQYWSSDKGLFQALKSLLTFVHTKSVGNQQRRYYENV